MPGEFSLLLLAKPLAWLAVVLAATLLLRRRQAPTKVRLTFLIGGVLVFGFFFGQVATGKLDPSPLDSLRNLLRIITGQQQTVPPIAHPSMVLFALVMPVLLLAIGWISNKIICGWVCQLGLLQDLIHRITSFPKWRPPFWLSNTLRSISFVGLLFGLLVAGIDWIGWIDPFQPFRFNFTLAIGLFAAFLLIASLFIYRPWCQFLCPFGFASWVVEQFSLLRPRINWDVCKQCQLCVKACPTGAMADIYSGKKLHADCFACGACLAACPQKGALCWRKK